MSANLQAQAQALNARLESEATAVIESLEKTKLRPIQRASYACILKCFDKAGTVQSTDQLNRCSQECQIPVQQAQAIVQQEVNQFQNRVNRGMASCQDEARDVVTGDINTDARQMRKFEQSFLGCVQKTVDHHIKTLQPMQKRVESNLKNL